jgi:hypothetical protein
MRLHPVTWSDHSRMVGHSELIVRPPGRQERKGGGPTEKAREKWSLFV